MTSFHLLLAFIFLQAGIPAPALPQPISPPRFPLADAAPPTVKSAPSSKLLLGPVTVTFNKTTLSQAISQIGVGRIEHQGDAGESSYWICYSVNGPTRKERVWLLSHGEMGGPDHTIHGVAAQVVSSSAPDPSCPELPPNRRSLRLDSGIWLGAMSSEVRKRFGEPSLAKDSWLHYGSRRKFRGAFYEYGALSARINAGSVVELWATLSVFD